MHVLEVVEQVTLVARNHSCSPLPDGTILSLSGRRRCRSFQIFSQLARPGRVAARDEVVEHVDVLAEVLLEGERTCFWFGSSDSMRCSAKPGSRLRVPSRQLLPPRAAASLHTMCRSSPPCRSTTTWPSPSTLPVFGGEPFGVPGRASRSRRRVRTVQGGIAHRGAALRESRPGGVVVYHREAARHPLTNQCVRDVRTR